MKTRNVPALILLLSVTAFIGACSNVKSEESHSKTKSIAVPEVEVIAPVSSRPGYQLVLPGELRPYEQVDVFAKAKGFIKKIYADRGARVKKGQLLAILEAPEISQQFLSVQSNEQKLYESYIFSRQAYQRLKKASQKNGAVAEIELERAKAQLRSDSAAYHSAKASTGASAQLKDYLRITAPFSGTIVERNVSAGALVGEGQAKPLFTLAQQEKLRLTVAVPEKHAHSIDGQTKAMFTVNNRPGKMYQAILSRNSGVLDQATRSVTVEFDVENQDESLSGGEYAQVNILMKRPGETLWVPASSVVQSQAGVFVLKVENDRIQRIPVTPGIQEKKKQEVFGELTTADMILKKGTEELEDGALVRIKSSK